MGRATALEAVEVITETAEWVANATVDRLGLRPAAPLRVSAGLVLADIQASVFAGDPAVLTRQLTWHDRQLTRTQSPVDVHTLTSVLLAELLESLPSGPATVVADHVRIARQRVPHHREDVPAEQRPLNALATAYLEHVLAGRRDEALALVLDSADEGLAPQDLLLDVLQPVQEEIGRLWEIGRIGVAQEHYVTAITELAIALLHPRLMPPPGRHRRVLATGVGFGAHEVGIRMVTETLEAAGWSATYLGTGTPVPDVVNEVAAQDAELLAVSASMSGHVIIVRHLIDRLREDPRTHDVPVVVGGRVFRRTPGLVRKVGADGFAEDARAAVGECDRLVPLA